MFDISIVFIYVDSDSPPNSVPFYLLSPSFLCVGTAKLTFLWYVYSVKSVGFWTANEREESSLQMWVLGTKEHCVWAFKRTSWAP